MGTHLSYWGGDEEVWVDDQSQPFLEKTLEVQEEVIENFKRLCSLSKTVFIIFNICQETLSRFHIYVFIHNDTIFLFEAD